jgi:exodeoxyribonuclease VII small subunit
MPAIKKTQPLLFREALEELEALVAQSEGNELDIERQLAAFERAQVLAQFCRKRLADIEVRVKELSKTDE